MRGEDHINDLIFAVFLCDRPVGGRDQRFDIFFRLFRLAIFDVRGKVQKKMAHIMPQDRNLTFGTADRSQFLFILAALQLHQPVLKLGILLFLILLEIQKDKQKIKNAEQKSQKLNDNL